VSLFPSLIPHSVGGSTGSNFQTKSQAPPPTSVAVFIYNGIGVKNESCNKPRQALPRLFKLDTYNI
jgi:hypothetical protein